MTLNQYLIRFNVTTQQLAKKIRMSKSSVSSYRVSRRMPRPDVIARIAKATSGKVQPKDWY